MMLRVLGRLMISNLRYTLFEKTKLKPNQITTTVETTLKTEIEFDSALESKISTAYAEKKEAVLSEMISVFDDVAETTDSEYNQEEIDVTFSEAR